jgi:hypothetical protein
MPFIRIDCMLVSRYGHDVHLLTCSSLPPGRVEAVGGIVAARSVR